MSKDAVADLKRTLLRLSLLEGAPLACLEGLHLVQVRAISLPAALLDAVWEQGGVSAAALERFCELKRPPTLVAPRFLAAAQCDLRVLVQNPDLRELAAELRALRRYGSLDAATLARRQSQIDALSARLRSAPGLAGPLELVEALRGEEAGRALAAWKARSIAWARERRRTAQRRVEAIAARFRGERGAKSDLPAEVLDGFIATLRPRAQRFAGRARDRVIYEVLAEAVAWPGAALHTPAELRELPPILAEAVEVAGALQLARIGSTRQPDYVRRLERALALLALLFLPESSGALTPDDVHFVLRELSSPNAQAESAPLTMAQGLLLLRLKLNPHDRAAAQKLLARGLEIELLGKLAAAKRLEGLRDIEDVDALRAWGRWVLDLAPRLRASGVELKLPPSNLPDGGCRTRPGAGAVCAGTARGELRRPGGAGFAPGAARRRSRPGQSRAGAGADAERPARGDRARGGPAALPGVRSLARRRRAPGSVLPSPPARRSEARAAAGTDARFRPAREAPRRARAPGLQRRRDRDPPVGGLEIHPVVEARESE